MRVRGAAAIVGIAVMCTTADASPPPRSGRPVSLDFAAVGVREVLRLLADVGRINLVVAAEVEGVVSIEAVDVPWETALDVVLEGAGLVAVRERDVTLVVAKGQEARARQLLAPAARGEPIELVLRDARVGAALQLLAEAAGRTVTPGRPLPGRRIDLRLRRLPVGRALQAVLASEGLDAHEVLDEPGAPARPDEPARCALYRTPLADVIATGVVRTRRSWLALVEDHEGRAAVVRPGGCVAREAARVERIRQDDLTLELGGGR